MQDTGLKYIRQGAYIVAIPNTGSTAGQPEVSYDEFINTANSAVNDPKGIQWKDFYDKMRVENPNAFIKGASSGITMLNGIPTETSAINPATGQVDINQALSKQAVSGVGAIPGMNTQTGEVVNREAFTQYQNSIKPPVTPIGNGVPGSSTDAPVLPTGTSNNLTTSYYTSLANTASNAQVNLDNMRNQQLQTIQQNKDRAQEELNSIRDNQAEGVAEQGNTALSEKQMILDRLNIEEQRFNENYNIAQGLTTKLTDLMTEGNSIIASVKGVTGLAGIRNPRIQEAINSVTAAVGVVKAGLDAANGQMGQAQSQLQLATSTIQAAFTDQIDYYKSLDKFYESMAGDASAKVVQLSEDERAYLDSKITDLEGERNRIQKMSDNIQQAMTDPDTALAYATAGVKLTDTPEQIGVKLAKYGYSKELSEQSKEMANDGWTPLISGKAPAGTTTTTRIDSQGNTKTYYKKATGSGTSSDFTKTEQKNYEAYKGEISSYSNKATAVADLNANKFSIIQDIGQDGYNNLLKDIDAYFKTPEISDQTAVNISPEMKGLTFDSDISDFLFN